MIPDGPAPPRERAINLPGVLVGAIAVLLLVHLGRQLVGDQEDLALVFRFGFVPASWSAAFGFARPDDVLQAVEAAGGDPDLVRARLTIARYVLAQGAEPWAPVSYALLHGSWAHVGLNCVWLAAFGAPVIRRAGLWRSAVLAVATAIGGVLGQWFAEPLGIAPVIGASAVVSGFMTAATTFMFVSPRDPGEAEARPPSRWSFLADRNVLVFLAVWFAINILFGVLAVPLGIAEGGIAWEAHIGGLLTALVLFPLLDPGRSAYRPA